MYECHSFARHFVTSRLTFVSNFKLVNFYEVKCRTSQIRTQGQTDAQTPNQKVTALSSTQQAGWTKRAVFTIVTDLNCLFSFQSQFFLFRH